MYMQMEYSATPDAQEEEYQPLEIDPGLLLRKDHLSWLFGLINSIPEQSDFLMLIKSDSSSLHFCISCNRYLTHGEDATSHRHHQPEQGPHHLFPLIMIQTQCKKSEHGTARNYYVSMQALREIQVPIGDVLSHVLPHPRADAGGDGTVRCLYVHPQNLKEAIWQGDAFSGRCAYRGCEKIFNHKQSHLRLYGITPQFCSISCKLNTWVCCNR